MATSLGAYNLNHECTSWKWFTPGVLLNTFDNKS